MESIVRTVCQGCMSECGAMVHTKDGKITKIEGDPNHPISRGYMCAKGRAQIDIHYHPDRINYPMRRIGKRGSGKWERVSWDEALNDIAKKLTEVKDKYGAESNCTYHGTGPRASMFSCRKLAAAIHSPNVVSTDLHICAIPSIVAQHFTWGQEITTIHGPDYDNSNCILTVGANPLIANPPRGIRILNAKKRGAKLIVIDPRKTELAAKADVWLQIRPGTDAALFLGMIKTIIDEELYDKEFVRNWCYGFDELKEHVKQYPVEKVAEITWLPAEKIKEAAWLFAATNPAALHSRVALDGNWNSVQTSRTVCIFVALCGNIDVAGGNLMYNRIKGIITSDADLSGQVSRPPIEIAEKRIGAKEIPLVSSPQAPMPWVLSPLFHDALRYGKPYPVKGVFLAGGNPVVNMQDAKTFRKSMIDHLDLLVVSDYFMTPTAEIADYVLPAAHWLERDDLCDMIYDGCVVARQKVVEPPYERWHDIKMVIELVKRLPWADKSYLPWDDVEGYIQWRLKESRISFEELKTKGYLIAKPEYKKYEKVGFNTLTKKVELYSTGFKEHGIDPLPSFIEPPESPVSTPELYKEYPLVLFTGARVKEYWHSQGRQIKPLRESLPDPLIDVHESTAKNLGLKNGDWVWVETPQVKGERVKLKVKINPGVDPRMVHAFHAWWFPEKPGPEHGCFESNINVVLTAEPAWRNKICASVPTRGTLCRIYKV